jgi:chromosome segregation ATPase
MKPSIEQLAAKAATVSNTFRPLAEFAEALEAFGSLANLETETRTRLAKIESDIAAKTKEQAELYARVRQLQSTAAQLDGEARRQSDEAKAALDQNVASGRAELAEVQAQTAAAKVELKRVQDAIESIRGAVATVKA